MVMLKFFLLYGENIEKNGMLEFFLL